jgi:hypothetical protein
MNDSVSGVDVQYVLVASTGIAFFSFIYPPIKQQKVNL